MNLEKILTEFGFPSAFAIVLAVALWKIVQLLLERHLQALAELTTIHKELATHAKAELTAMRRALQNLECFQEQRERETSSPISQKGE